MTQRYVLRNGLLTDTDNDVMWKITFEKQDDGSDLFTFDEAKARFKGFDEYGDFDDWRLPTLNECKGIIDSDLFRDIVKLNALFKRIQGNWMNGFWTSTPSGTEYAWRLGFKEGEEKIFNSTPDKLFVGEWDRPGKFGVVLCRTVDE